MSDARSNAAYSGVATMDGCDLSGSDPVNGAGGANAERRPGGPALPADRHAPVVLERPARRDGEGLDALGEPARALLRRDEGLFAGALVAHPARVQDTHEDAVG